MRQDQIIVLIYADADQNTELLRCEGPINTRRALICPVSIILKSCDKECGGNSYNSYGKLQLSSENLNENAVTRS